MPTAHVTVPATTANIGPGFDCLGAALTLYNQFEFASAKAGVHISVEGEEAHRVRTDKGNLAYRAFAALYKKLGQTPPSVNLTIKLTVPLSRGLGSSSTAIVGGLVGANLLAGSALDDQGLAAIATEIEGHPDNVVPALLGGCRLAASSPQTENSNPWTLCEVPWHDEIVPIVAIPDFELSTTEARRVLPKTYSRADAIFNTAHLGLLLRGLNEGRRDWVQTALADRLHQPYRQKLIAGYDTVRQAALAAGAWGLVISGAGPTLLA
ncbi:MAG: homoserine kinase, partial [Cyanobacteria bacterium P01_F01_bin.4]